MSIPYLPRETEYTEHANDLQRVGTSVRAWSAMKYLELLLLSLDNTV